MQVPAGRRSTSTGLRGPSGRFDLGPVSAAEGEYRAPRLPSPQDWVLVLKRE